MNKRNLYHRLQALLRTPLILYPQSSALHHSIQLRIPRQQRRNTRDQPRDISEVAQEREGAGVDLVGCER